MSNEAEAIESIFDSHKLWKGKYRVRWCDLCDTYTIGCNQADCSGSSCNGHGCEHCVSDHNDFNKAKTSPIEYLNLQEKVVYEKIWFLKKYIKESLAESEYEINWKRMKQQGHLCRHAETLFAKEIEESFAKNPDVKYGDY